MNIIEQLRQKDKAAARLIEEKERKENLQMMGIAIFILAFFGVLSLWSKRKIKPKSLRYIGLLGLLLMFEFISYLLHPVIGKITHHIPVLFVLTSVAIASTILPIHHRLEHWVEKELAHKRKQGPKTNAHRQRKPKVVKEEDEQAGKVTSS